MSLTRAVMKSVSATFPASRVHRHLTSKAPNFRSQFTNSTVTKRMTHSDSHPTKPSQPQKNQRKTTEGRKTSILKDIALFGGTAALCLLFVVRFVDGVLGYWELRKMSRTSLKNTSRQRND